VQRRRTDPRASVDPSTLDIRRSLFDICRPEPRCRRPTCGRRYPKGAQGRPNSKRRSETVKRLRVGNGCGFWGDNLDAPIRLAESGRLDYLTLEYLAELTMSILALQKQRDPAKGYAGDFLDVLARLAPTLQSQPNLRVITNAGGMNPTACAAKARAILDRAGLTHRRILTVSGDDLMPNLDQLLKSG